MELVIRGKYALYFSSDSKLHFIEDPGIIIEQDKIVNIGKYSEVKKDIVGHDKVGDKNQLLIPGLINGHTHLAMTLFRGIADDLPLNIWLQDHIWPMERNLNAEDVYYGAKLGAIESLLAGVTTINSMYWYPEEEAKAIKDTLMRGMVGPPVISGMNNLKKSLSIATNLHNSEKGRIRATLSLHSPYTVTISDFVEANEYILNRNQECEDEDKLLIHTHLAEPEDELTQAKKFNLNKNEDFPDVNSSVDLMEQIGLLHEYLLTAHCIHVSREDIIKLQKNKVRVIVNPLSNSKLGNHMPPLDKMIRKIENLGLGTDGPASNNTLNVFDTVRYIALFYKGLLSDPEIIKAKETFWLATIGGAKALRWKGIGSLEQDSLADIVTIDLKKPHLTPTISSDSLLSHFAYSMNGSEIKNVIVNGKIVIKNYDFDSIIIEKVLEEVEKKTLRLLKKEDD